MLDKNMVIQALFDQGFNLMPCKPKSKFPALDSWKKYQNEKYVGDISAKQNYAVICGFNDLIVVDLDSKDLFNDFKEFFNKTWVVESVKGYHIYFQNIGPKKNTKTLRLKNSKGQRIDVQAQGAYVVGAGSIHPDTNEQYKLFHGGHVMKIDFQIIVKKLEKLGFKREFDNLQVDQVIKGVDKGSRHSSALKYALHLLFKVGLDKEAVRLELKNWNQRNAEPLPDTELIQIIEDAIKYNDKNKPTEIKEKDFTINKKGKEYAITLLDKPITQLRPLTLLKDGTRMILVYLPVKIIDTKEKNPEPQFSNQAFFIIHNPKDKDPKKRLHFEDSKLKENYKIDVLPTWNESRWEIKDLNQWLSEDKPTDPKILYNLENQRTKEYFDFPDHIDYPYYNLWNIATYFYELFDAFPYNDYTGTKRAGKTKALEFQKYVCFNSIMSADITGSAFFRMVEGLGATVLLDETEQFKRQKNETAQHVRTLLIAGYLKDQYAIRSEGKANEGFTPVTYNLFSPKSMAHIQTFDDVLEDRCIPQLMRRAKDKEKLNTWPESNDPNFQKIRNLCYRLFLDYADEIKELSKEARKNQTVTGRELKLWIPIITMALFFEKHGIEGLVNTIQIKTTESSQERQIQDEEESKDMQIIKYLDIIGVQLGEDETILNGNPTGWLLISELYKHLIADSEKYDVNEEYFKRWNLTQTLRRLGLKTNRKKKGISWLITRKEIDEVKERMGMIEPKQQPKPKQQPLL